MNGAESLVRTLSGAGVEVCFANPGTSEMHFVDALDRTGAMRCVLGLFEGVVTAAADGYARMAHKPAVTLLHLAPGFANGCANIHNAKKARSPMVNLVGDHAIRHLTYEAPLTGDVEGTARPFSHFVRTATSAATIGADGAAAVAAALGSPNQIATLIAPADTGWDEGGVVAPPLAATEPAAFDQDALHSAAQKLGPGALILVGGTVLEDEAALAALAGVADKTGAKLMAPVFNRRIERGRGRTHVPRVPYPVDAALDVLRDVRVAIMIEAEPPIAFFAYPERPSELLPEGTEVITIAAHGARGPEAALALAAEVGAAPATPPAAPRPKAPGAVPIEAGSLAAAIAAALPENVIVVDESISSGRDIYARTAASPPMTWLALTGGSIGIGLPLATGAAVAAPDRPVVTLQADGSAMYTIQALWTQAREGLNVTTVILANRGYAILKNELTKVGANPGRSALDMLEINRPDLDFVALAKGMGVPGKRVDTARDLALAIEAAVAEPGPFLIEAAM